MRFKIYNNNNNTYTIRTDHIQVPKLNWLRSLTDYQKRNYEALIEKIKYDLEINKTTYVCCQFSSSSSLKRITKHKILSLLQENLFVNDDSPVCQEIEILKYSIDISAQELIQKYFQNRKVFYSIEIILLITMIKNGEL